MTSDSNDADRFKYNNMCDPEIKVVSLSYLHPPAPSPGWRLQPYKPALAPASAVGEAGGEMVNMRYFLFQMYHIMLTSRILVLSNTIYSMKASSSSRMNAEHLSISVDVLVDTCLLLFIMALIFLLILDLCRETFYS